MGRGKVNVRTVVQYASVSIIAGGATDLYTSLDNAITVLAVGIILVLFSF